MAIRTESPNLLDDIRNAKTLPQQITALRALKNDIIGHQQSREMWLTLGLIDPVVNILEANKPSTRRSGKESKTSLPRSLSEEEMVRFQAISIVGSLAYGGPSFIAPLHAANILPPLLSNLSPSTNPPNLVLATLRTLNTIASSTLLASIVPAKRMAVLAEALFSKPHITSLAQIIGQKSSSIPVQSQINMATKLISIVCQEERHRQNLANGGVLDALASKLAGVVVSSGCVVPEAVVIARQEGIFEDLPGPAPRTLDKTALLEAISIIIEGSKLRASQLLYSPAILAVLPSIPVSDLPSLVGSYAEAWARFNGATVSERQAQLNAVDTLLPHLPRHPNRSASALSSAFPPLGTPGIREFITQTTGASLCKFTNPTLFNWQNTSATEEIAVQEGKDDHESHLVPWLFFHARTSRSLEQLMAISVLTVLYRFGLTSKTKEFEMLIVPLLASLLSSLNETSKQGKEPRLDDLSLTREWAINERVPAIIASLVKDNEAFQKAAVDAGAIKNLYKMLKLAYEPVPKASKSKPWNPIVSTIPDTDAPAAAHASRLGEEGLSPLLLHKINIRESVLNAIAAIVPFKDEYRKEVIQTGAVAYIVESMKPKPSKASRLDSSNTSVSETSDLESNHGYGINPVTVLIAASNAVRALSRSVSILRTTLIDCGVAQPLFQLLEHGDIDVEIAATAAICNLCLDCSPAREEISKAGVVSILCRHAHSTNSQLKLNAMWALKHLVLSAGNDDKKACLRELGQGWLVQLVTENTEDTATLTTRGSGNSEVSNVAMDDDVDMDQPDSESEDSKMSDTVPADSEIFVDIEPTNSRPTSGHSHSLQIAKTRLAELREAEKRAACKALRDDIAVQEQGLDFIRNLIGGVGQGGGGGAVGAAEMVDFLFECLGQDRVFDILASKLRSRVIQTSSGARVQPAQPEIIIAVAYILVQMAASVPRHRQLIISQTDLLKLLTPQFGHPNKEVRLALCHLVTNLTWVDDLSDVDECRLRVTSLVRMGFLKKLEGLAETDGELDVRERSKHAVWQMKEGM